jgi:hypothetical protein
MCCNKKYHNPSFNIEKSYFCCQQRISMMNQPQEIISKLTNALFWDVDPETIDCKKHAPYVVERVLSMGTLDDFKVIKSFYGKTKIKYIAMKLRYMDERVLQFCSIYFNTPVTEFRCYTSMQLNHSHWTY